MADVRRFIRGEVRVYVDLDGALASGLDPFAAAIVVDDIVRQFQAGEDVFPPSWVQKIERT